MYVLVNSTSGPSGSLVEAVVQNPQIPSYRHSPHKDRVIKPLWTIDVCSITINSQPSPWRVESVLNIFLSPFQRVLSGFVPKNNKFEQGTVRHFHTNQPVFVLCRINPKPGVLCPACGSDCSISLWFCIFMFSSSNERDPSAERVWPA